MQIIHDSGKYLKVIRAAVDCWEILTARAPPASVCMIAPRVSGASRKTIARTDRPMTVPKSANEISSPGIFLFLYKSEELLWACGTLRKIPLLFWICGAKTQDNAIDMICDARSALRELTLELLICSSLSLSEFQNVCPIPSAPFKVSTRHKTFAADIPISRSLTDESLDKVEVDCLGEKQTNARRRMDRCRVLSNSVGKRAWRCLQDNMLHSPT